MIRGKKTFWIISTLAFFLHVAYALPLYIQSAFLGQYISLPIIGMFITLATIVSLVTIIFFPRFIKKYTNYRCMMAVAGIHALDTLLLMVSQHPLTLLITFIIHFVTITLLIINLDIFLEDISDNKKTGKTRTVYLTVVNAAILISPAITGFLLEKTSTFQLPYLISFFMLCIVLAILFWNKKHLNDHISYERRHLFELFSILKHRPNMAKVFSLSFILRFFFAIMIIYTPLYLHDTVGFSWSEIGIIFTIMLLPYVLLEIPAGKLADNYIGEKEMLVAGLLIMAIFTGLMSYIGSTSVAVWTGVLFLTRIGSALVEGMHEVYFFKIVNRKDADIINLFRDLTPASWLVASITSVLFLKIFDLRYIFLFLACAILLTLYPALTLKDTK